MTDCGVFGKWTRVASVDYACGRGVLGAEHGRVVGGKAVAANRIGMHCALQHKTRKVLQLCQSVS